MTIRVQYRKQLPIPLEPLPEPRAHTAHMVYKTKNCVHTRTCRVSRLTSTQKGRFSILYTNYEIEVLFHSNPIGGTNFCIQVKKKCSMT